MKHDPIRVAILGTGMMGQEHVSYLIDYPQCELKFLCDTDESMLSEAARAVETKKLPTPMLLENEDALYEHRKDFDLLVISTPNFLHTPMLLRWGQEPITILCEKPVAINHEQIEALKAAQSSFLANVWIAME